MSVHIRELENLIGNDHNIAIVDIRSTEEYSEGHLPGSQNIPKELFAGKIEELKKFEKIYVHCRSGNRIKILEEELKDPLPDNFVLLKDSGFMHWEMEGKPVDKG